MPKFCNEFIIPNEEPYKLIIKKITIYQDGTIYVIVGHIIDPKIE